MNEAEHFAREAARLMDDEALQRALDAIRSAAIDALIRADATVTHDVVRLQAKIAVIDDLRGEIRQTVEQFTSKSRPALVC